MYLWKRDNETEVVNLMLCRTSSTDVERVKTQFLNNQPYVVTACNVNDKKILFYEQ